MMKKRLLCLFLFCTLLICACAVGEPDSSGESRSPAPSADTSSDTSPDASEDTSSDPTPPVPDPPPDPPEEKDFFDLNGQGKLPEKAVLPASCTATDTEHLYAFPFALPEEETLHVVSVRLAGDTVHLFYTIWVFEEDTGDYDVLSYYRVCSLETGELLTEKQLPEDAFCGPLSDGGFWYATAEGIALTLCSKDGTETVARQASSNYSGDNAPYLLALSPDGNTLLAAFGAQDPFLLLDLATGVRTLVSTDVRAQSWSLLSAEQDAFLLAGSRGALLELSVSEAVATALPEGDPVSEASGRVFRLPSSGSGLALRGQSPDENGTHLLLASFLYDDEVYAAQDFGCCATTSWDCNTRFYDLRTGNCFASLWVEELSNVFACFSPEGFALLTNGYVCYVYDLSAAYAESTRNDVIEMTYTDAATVDEYFARRVRVMEDTYGIALHVGSAGNDFEIWGYVGQVELDPVEIYRALNLTDSILSRYPAGMLRETYEGLCDALHLYLCADLYGYASDGLSRAGGATMWDGEKIVMAIDIYNGLETTLPHELSHAFDVRIELVSASSEQNWMQLWENLHSFDNAYAYSYEDYYYLDDYTFYGESSESRIWFVDSYARTFPTEDRARIIENLFNPVDDGLPEVLQAPHLQEKARFYSYILRQCFPSCAASEEPLYWETYLGVIDENAVSSFLPEV
ncbi:MAG: hypothetical protein J1E00_09440 [Oscillospiraceae bacterium]|nr:hypothetical protein [Oscillospiraceae bacterium]